MFIKNFTLYILLKLTQKRVGNVLLVAENCPPRHGKKKWFVDTHTSGKLMAHVPGV